MLSQGTRKVKVTNNFHDTLRVAVVFRDKDLVSSQEMRR